jgi:hypothetical protein
MPTMPVEIFLSYSHKDERLLGDLRDHLAPMKRDGLITDWHDRRIVAGDDWSQVIGEALDRCRIVLLLVSSSFFASDYATGVEVGAALRRHRAGEARVIPVILRPVDWQGSELSRLQALPTNAKPVTEWRDRHQAFRDVAGGVRAAIMRLASDPLPSRPGGVDTRPLGGYFLNHTSFLRRGRQSEFRKRTGVPLDHFDIRVVLDAEDPELLDSVERVEYTLHAAYPEPVRVRTSHDRPTKFLLKELANGEYLLRAKVYLTNVREPLSLERYITLWRSGPELP